MKNKLAFLLLMPALLVCFCTNNGGQTSSKELENITDVKFEDKHFNYDGKQHSLEVTGAPEHTTIVYENNDKVEIGKINVYYNDDGYYQGLYERYGYVENYQTPNLYGQIHYYGEWAD